MVLSRVRSFLALIAIAVVNSARFAAYVAASRIDDAFTVFLKPTVERFRAEILPLLSERSLSRRLKARVAAYVQRRVERASERRSGAPLSEGWGGLGLSLA